MIRPRASLARLSAIALLAVAAGCVDAPPPHGEDIAISPRVIAPPLPRRTTDPEAAARPRHFDPRALSAILNAPPRARFRTTDGITIATDFPRDLVESEIGDDLVVQTAALTEIFGPVDLSRLLIAIHGDAEHSVAGVPVNAVHREGEVHLFVGDGGTLSTDAGAHLRHELVHAWLFLAKKSTPRWLDEGLAQTLSAIARDGQGELELLPRSDFITVFGKLRALDRTPRLLELLESTLDYPDPARLGAFYIASWSFTHYALEHGVGSLRDRVDDLMRATRVEWMALGPGWLADPATTDPVAAWLPFALAFDDVRGDRGERALVELANTPNWILALRSLAAAHPTARVRAARLLEVAPVDPAAFELSRVLAEDDAPSVRRAAARSVFTNESWLREGRAELIDLANHPMLSAPATLALALGRDREALRRWTALAATLPRAEAIDALLALKRALPDSAPAIETNHLLSGDFDVATALRQIAEYVATTAGEGPTGSGS